MAGVPRPQRLLEAFEERRPELFEQGVNLLDFGAQESLRVGWINAVLPTRGFNDQALLWAAAIAEKPAPALNAAKRSIVFGSRMTFADALALEHQLFSDLSATSKTLKTETAR